MIAAGLLASPFLLDYDLTLLAIPLAWAARRRGARDGFAPGEKIALLLASDARCSGGARGSPAALGLPIAPLAIAATLVFVVPPAAGRAASFGDAKPLLKAMKESSRERRRRRLRAGAYDDQRKTKSARAPGKTCGPCTMCCSVLEIVEMKKPAGPVCAHCRAGGGCGIYPSRPRCAASSNANG